jgi:2-oxoisovalerate dehydrogenase E1 component
MQADPRVTLYGEDIEDPKGDVFGVTRGLTTAFADRVLNSPLSESTIIGNSIGRALAGGRPVAFIQFADFIPLAFNQLASELGSLAWRTNGGWKAPVIVMVSCGGYRPG